MKIIRLHHIYILILCVASAQFSFAQKSIQSLKSEAEQAKKEIELTSSLLKQTEQNKSASLQRLSLLNQQIQSRQQYLNTLQYEITDLEKSIASSSGEIELMQDNLKRLQDEYKQSLLLQYKLRSSYDQLIFILSADDFNQAYNRLKYLQYYTDNMIRQTEKIKAMQDSVETKLTDYKHLVLQKQTIIESQKKQTQQLSKDKHQQNLLVQELTGKQKQLQNTIQEKRALAQRLDKQIQDAIRAEIKAAEARAKAEAAKNKSASTSTLTPAEKLISKNFVENKGRLPWPTLTGTITEKFGTHKHPTLGFDVENNGIDISTTKQAKARAVFNGTVSKIVVIPGKNTAVIIKHGNYYSVYNNLINVTIKTGDTVVAKQEIGTIFTDPATGATVLQLQIWKELEKQNPELWLSK